MSQKDSLPPYVLITPARNEETFIEKTLQSVAQQTFLPVKWVIVNDGSTDRTGEIVAGYAEKYHWIELVKSSKKIPSSGLRGRCSKRKAATIRKPTAWKGNCTSLVSVRCFAVNASRT